MIITLITNVQTSKLKGMKSEILRFDLKKKRNQQHATYKNPTLNIEQVNIQRRTNINHTNTKQEKTGLAILISDKIEIRMRNIMGENFIMKNGSIHEEDIMILMCIY